MKKLLGTAALLSLVAVGPVMGADQRVKLPTKAPPKAVAYSWTGCYVGANGGYGQQRSHSNDITIINGGLGTVVPFPEPSLGPKGGFAGGQIGCNYQTNQFVWGVEGDIQGSDIHDGFGPARFTVPGVLTLTDSENLRWFATVRGRLGIAAQDRLLVYVTGGVAFGKTQYNQFSLDAANNTDTLNGDTSRTGYVVGGGIEWAFSGAWTAKAEYQYLNFGSIGPLSSLAFTPAGIPTGATVNMGSFRNDYQTVRFGLNYRFNPAPAAVAAKY
jgi:outer membrane immunogenic protein